MIVQVRIIGNLPYLIHGLQRQYQDLTLPEGACLAQLLHMLNIERELFAIVDGKRINMDTPLEDGMEIAIISPSMGG